VTSPSETLAIIKEMAIKRHILVGFAALLLLLASATTASAAGMNSLEAKLLRVVNKARASHGLRPVRYDATLERAARAHSAEMLAGGYFDHGDFGGRMRAFGARGPFLGENLAWGTGPYAAAGNIVREWLASPEHRENLLRPGFRRIGIGALAGAFQGQGSAVVITADFAGR
jgi:uncharacterized protein YkwD